MTWRSDGAVVMTMALSYDISHQRDAMAAVNVLPAPLQDRTATCWWLETALRMSHCLSQGSTFNVCRANLTGLSRNKRWLAIRSSLGGVGLRAATERFGFLGLG